MESMNLHRRLNATLRLIAVSLFPPKTADGAAYPGETAETVVIPPERIASYLAVLSRLTTESGTARLVFPGVFPMAAPFLLFRLKRLGYTARAECDECALQLVARR